MIPSSPENFNERVARTCESKSNAALLLGLSEVKYLDGSSSHPGPHAWFFMQKSTVFHGAGPCTATWKKRNIVRVSSVPSGTRSPPLRQQLINRPRSSPETKESHRPDSLSLRAAFRVDCLFFVYR